jgi:hypothetical protein
VSRQEERAELGLRPRLVEAASIMPTFEPQSKRVPEKWKPASPTSRCPRHRVGQLDLAAGTRPWRSSASKIEGSRT